MGEAEGAGARDPQAYSPFRDKETGERVEALRQKGPFRVQRLDGTWGECEDGWIVWKDGLARPVSAEEFEGSYLPTD